MNKDHLHLLTSQESWVDVQARVYAEMGALPERFHQLLAAGVSAREAMAELTLEAFDIQARSCLALISDRATLTAYLALLPVLAEGQRQKVCRKVHKLGKPEGTADKVWQFLTSCAPGLDTMVDDPLGAEIVWFESELSLRATRWAGEAHKRVQALGEQAASRSAGPWEPEQLAGAAAGPDSAGPEQPEAATVVRRGRGRQTERRAAVEAYIDEVHRRTGMLISRADIWKAAGYKDRRQFERWQSHDPKASRAANERITRILTRKPHLKQL
ncbi:MAG: hypothetical protein AAB654_03030 [Acidobacteriota bacterium]